MDSPTLVATVILGGLLAAWCLWHLQARKLLQKRLQVWVERCQETRAADRAAALDGRLMRLLELDPGEAAALSAASGVRLQSLGDYFSTLRPHGPVSWERALVSAADRLGLAAVLPLALFLPNRWRTEKAAGGLLAGFPSLAASALVETAISTIDLFAFSQTAHLYVAGQRRKSAAKGSKAAAAPGTSGSGLAAEAAAAEAKLASANAAKGSGKPPSSLPSGPMDILRHGQNPASGPTPLDAAPSPVLLSRQAVAALLGLTEAEAADDALAPGPEPRTISPLLPDLFLGNGGLHLVASKAGQAACGLMAAVANRLTANALAGLPAAQAHVPAAAQQAARFAVCLQPGGAPLTSLEAFLAALVGSGHSVQLVCSSNLTSFGAGLSVKDGDSGWVQVPLAYPIRCAGLYAVDERGDPVDVLTLVSHGSIQLHVRGPQLTFALEWCLNVSGFTGWLPYASLNREWAIGEPFRCLHPLSASPSAAAPSAAVSEPSDLQRVARLITAATCIGNTAAQRHRLLFGGYGYSGVCLDSVALIQQAVLGRCTLYPLLLGGEAKFSLMQLYYQAQAAHGGSTWQYAAEGVELGAALAALPCDAIQEPRTAADGVRRALACLPQRSVFAAVAVCRRGLEASLKAAQQLCPDA